VFETNINRYKAEIEADINAIIKEYEKQVAISRKQILESQNTLNERAEKGPTPSVDENHKALKKALGKDLNSEIIDGVKSNIDKVNKVQVGDDK